jgi:uncharacterized protein YggU (UPF0235/DUF167 family)
MRAWALRADGIAIVVRVTPRSARELLAAGTEDYFTARLTPPPVEGAANDALLPLVAKTFGVAKSAVTIVAGTTARLKRLDVRGDVTTLAQIAARLYEPAP